MSSPDIPIPLNVQENQISGNLNSSMLLNFLMGWYFLDWVVVINGDTRESIFSGGLGESPQWIWVLSDFLVTSSFVVADGLLIWRCYHVWGQSFRAILAPLILLVVEFGLFLATIVLKAKLGEINIPVHAILFNNIRSALIFVSLGTTAITTFLIVYRIYSASRLNALPSKRLFNRIVVMIIESAAAYTLLLAFETITVIVPSFNNVGSTWSEVSYYVQAVLSVVANQGMAPTILVARIATNDNHTIASSTITHISGLQFGPHQGSGSGRSGNTTGGDINASVHADNADPSPMIEVKMESNADAPFGDNQV
ncbi:hypothetical protein CVT25_008472 [Psilocybe cyanescens]|uniref:Uncharacterized protein n=1 Tax=Psilocybe cyanescens TaxID=93625 RepID=A0A409XA34_PSICY|nr:hypothetical protein CVT25_008472 [Psilocybe cyanescens]